MARNPVTPVIPVDPVGRLRPVDKGSTYFRHLELWRVHSEYQAAERRRKIPPAAPDGEFAKVLSDSQDRADKPES